MEESIVSKADFTILFNNNYNHLVIYVMRYVQDISVANDLVQGVFVTVWEKRETVKSPVPFLFACAKHAALKYLSNLSKQKFISTNDGDLTDPQFLVQEEDDTIEYFVRLEKISVLINQLPPQCKDVVKKIYFEKKKIAVVAQEMALSVNTIKTHIKIAKKKISNLFLFLIIFYFYSI